MPVTLSATTSDGTEANHRTTGRDSPSTAMWMQDTFDDF